MTSPPRYRQRCEIRTWRMGEVGTGATRRVLPGGVVVIGESRGSKSWRREFRGDALIPLVGQIVYVEDIDDDRGWYFYTCAWHDNGRVSADRFLAILEPIVVDPHERRSLGIPDDRFGDHPDAGKWRCARCDRRWTPGKPPRRGTLPRCSGCREDCDVFPADDGGWELAAEERKRRERDPARGDPMLDIAE